MRVAVVGAGLAGLACATDLAQGGVDVTVLEARGRVGGRVWTGVMRDGALVERGGEFIERGNDHLLRRAGRYGLGVVPQGFQFAGREVRAEGEALPALLIEAERALAATVTLLGKRSAAISAAEALVQTALAPLARCALTRRLEGTFTVPLDRVSALWLTRAEARAGASEVTLPSSRLAAGNDALAKAMAADLGERLRLACPVQVLRPADDGIALVTPEGTEHYARAVLAVPLPLALRVLPALRERPSSARLQWGIAAKLHVPLAEPADPRAVQGLAAAFWAWTARDAGGGPAMLASSFAGGLAASRSLEIELGAERWVAELQNLWPELELRGEPVLTNWGTDRWAAGSYSCHPPGWSRRDDEDVAAPYGRVHLAGEHTAGDFCGTMEGALRSGARAAAELMAGRDGRNS